MQREKKQGITAEMKCIMKLIIMFAVFIYILI